MIQGLTLPAYQGQSPFKIFSRERTSLPAHQWAASKDSTRGWLARPLRTRKRLKRSSDLTNRWAPLTTKYFSIWIRPPASRSIPRPNLEHEGGLDVGLGLQASSMTQLGTSTPCTVQKSKPSNQKSTSSPTHSHSTPPRDRRRGPVLSAMVLAIRNIWSSRERRAPTYHRP